jgi:sporulation protein YlmC with PRC-barrel domain
MLIACLTLGLAALPAAAQEPPAKQADAARKPPDVRLPRDRVGQPVIGQIIPGSALLNSHVQTRTGEELGRVKDLLLDLEEGAVVMAVVSTDRGERLPLPPGILRLSGKQRWTAEIEPEKLQKSPRFPKGEPQAAPNRLWAVGVYAWFNQEPRWKERQSASAEGTAARYSQVYDPKTETTIRGKIEKVDYQAPPIGLPIATQLTLSTDQGDRRVCVGPPWFLSRRGIAFREGDEVEVSGSQVKSGGDWLLVAARLQLRDRTIKLRNDDGSVVWQDWSPQDNSYGFTSLKSLFGTPVVNAEGEELGKIEDFAISLEHHLVAYAAVSCTCFDGAADKRFPIPLGSFIVKSGEKAWTLELPLEVLEATPTFSPGQWPEKLDRAWVEYVHVRYGRAPLGGVQTKE